MRRNKPYKLSVIAKEVARLNIVEDVPPANYAYRQPSDSVIAKRVEKLRRLVV